LSVQGEYEFKRPRFSFDSSRNLQLKEIEIDPVYHYFDPMSDGEASKGTTGSGKLYIGPAGWSYKDWEGPVYPPGKKLDKLQYIARYFDCIELNSSFYRIPDIRLSRSWAERLSDNPDFKFTVKVWQRFTHERKAGRDELLRFTESFEPLIKHGKFGAFLLQFPWSFRNDPKNREYVSKLGSLFSEYPTAVELRHGSWSSPEVWELLSGCKLSFCNIDQPLIGDSIPPTSVSTDGRLGYIRLHGRNRKNWFRREAGRDERYDYLYSMEELKGWVNGARKILANVKALFMITNNHFRGQALANAFQLKSILEGSDPDIPASLISYYPGLVDIAGRSSMRGDLFDGV